MVAPKQIRAVFDDDLPKLLQDLGLWEDFEQGKIRCAFTNEVITMDNFLGIFSDGENIKFASNNDVARAKFAELGQKNHE